VARFGWASALALVRPFATGPEIFLYHRSRHPLQFAVHTLKVEENQKTRTGEPATLKSSPFEFTGRIRSFKYAFSGIFHLLRSQHNAWIHAFATLLVVVAGFSFQITPAEWCWLILSMAFVWTAEAMNTALELLCDAATQEFHPLIGRAKDVAAGGVLLAAIGALTIGLIIFLPRIHALFFEPHTPTP
jgi:diacylglycerol kinase